MTMQNTVKQLFFILAIFFTLTVAQGQTWQWAKNPQGHGADYSWDISADPFGSSYITGVFYDSIQFGNNITLQSDLGTWDPFIAKYDASGNILWANKIVGQTGFNYFPNGISIDDSQNSYLIGEFVDTLQVGSAIITTPFYNDSCFDPWTFTWIPCVKYYIGVFVAKFNSNGNLVWLKKICESKNGNLYGNAISVDNFGNCHITGAFADTLNFNNSTTIISSGGTTDIFIAKTDSNGNGQWIQKAGGFNVNADYGTDIKVDISGNTYITGTYLDTATFDSFVLYGSAMFLAKYDVSGNCLWAQKMGNIGEANSIDVDKFGNCFVTGEFYMQAIFDTISLTSYGIDDIFLAKYSSSGNCIWAKKAGGYYYDEGYGVAVDTIGNCYITGDFRDVVNFDNIVLTSNGIDAFVAKYNSIGNIVWVVKAGGTGNYTDEGWGIALDNSGAVFVTGMFEYTSLLGSNSLTSAGGTDVFVAKLFDNTLGLNENNVNNCATFIFPNPFSSQTVLQTDNPLKNATLKVDNCFGQTVKQINNISGQTVTLHRDNLPSGLYFIRLTQDNKIITTNKLIITD